METRKLREDRDRHEPDQVMRCVSVSNKQFQITEYKHAKRREIGLNYVKRCTDAPNKSPRLLINDDRFQRR